LKIIPISATSAPQPSGGYAQAVDVVGAQRLVFVSGQIPETVQGDVPTEFADQARLVWRNVTAQLEAAGLSVANLVKVTTFLPSRNFSAPNREVREAMLGTHRPALTVVIAEIFDERWLLEIEAVAAA